MTIFTITLTMLFLAVSFPSYSENLMESDQDTTHDSIFDLEKEIITIPDTHENPEPYKWNVTRNPKNYGFSLKRDPAGPYILGLSMPDDLQIQEMHVFVTNKKLEFAHHVVPEKVDRHISWSSR